MIVTCKGIKKECDCVDDIKSLANYVGYTQFLVYQDGKKVTPSTIDFDSDADVVVIPYDKFAGTLTTKNGVVITFDEDAIDIGDKVIVIQLEEKENNDDVSEDVKDNDNVSIWM